MQKSGGSNKKLEIRLAEIKTYIGETLGKQFERHGYSFKKSDFTFKKKRAKYLLQFSFNFYDYDPLRYEINFSVLVMNEQIQNIKNKLPAKPSTFSFNAQSVYFYLGDFVDGTRENLNNNFRRHFAHSVRTSEDLFQSAENIKLILEKDILQEVDQMATIEGIEAFFKKRRVWWSTSSLLLNNILAELISTNLANPKDYKSVYTQIRANIHEKTNIAFPPEALGILESLDNFLILK